MMKTIESKNPPPTIEDIINDIKIGMMLPTNGIKKIKWEDAKRIKAAIDKSNEETNFEYKEVWDRYYQRDIICKVCDK